jgi:glycosyltransferase involved in cell wall biosynthesis
VDLIGGVKVLLTSGIYPPDIGGPATFIPQLAKYLTQTGHTVKVVTLGDGNLTESAADWNIIYISRNSTKIIRILRTIITLWRESKNCDFVFCNGLYIEAGITLKFNKKPSIAKIVGDPVWERFRNKSQSRIDLRSFNNFDLNFLQYLERKLFVFCLSGFKGVICPSMELVKYVKSWGFKGPVTFIANPVTIEPAEKVDSLKKYDVVTVSRLVPWKNIDKLIEVCSLNDWTLGIIGSGPEENILSKLAKTLNARVDFIGQKSSNLIPNYLRQGKVFALISDYEGMSFALLQALSCGIPVVVSNNAGNLGVVTHGYDGLICSLPELKDLEANLKNLLEEDIAKDFSKSGILTIQKKFSSAVIFPRIIQEIQGVFENAR